MAASFEGLLRQLPAERATRPSARKSTSSSVNVDRNTLELLRNAAANLAVSLDTFLYAGFSALLSRLAWQESVSVARLAEEPTVAIVEWEEGSSFRNGVAAIQRTNGILFDIQISEAIYYQFVSTEGKRREDAALLLTAVETGDGLELILSSAEGQWAAGTLDGWLQALQALLRGVAENPDMPLRRVPLGSEAALREIYGALNQTAFSFDQNITTPMLIVRKAKESPAADAVIFGEKRLSYRELDELSFLWAQRLIALGAGADCPVAICMERSEMLPVALLAVLRSGSCYVPLDTHHPRTRLEMILEECMPVAVLSDAASSALVEDVASPVLLMDTSPQPLAAEGIEPKIAPDNLAYTIYTSGTTGKPKGVQLTHRSLTNLLLAIQREPGMKPSDRMLAVATISFDIATMDMLLPLVTGATLIVADRHAGGDPDMLADLLEKHDVTVLQATPFTWRLLVSSGWTGKPGLKMIAGGEALPRDLANELAVSGGELWNCYGPTETTIYSSVIHIRNESGVVPVGPPLANTAFYVMDENGRPVPHGVAGELYIGGMGVSRGYLQRPDLTAERFVDDVFGGTGQKFFRTGDLVRLLPTSELEFLGRLDHQVKLRGFRIELAEIESVLRTHPAVENAAVTLREDVPGEPRLVAYVLLQGEKPKTKELSSYIGQSLPEYMVPARIVVLDRFPLTGSGKVDKRALPAPENVPGQEESYPAIAGVPPASDLEATLLDIFRTVLSNRNLGVTDNFFDYGGYSLLTVRLFSRIHRHLGAKLPISLLFDAPTPRALAQIIESGAKLPIIVPIRSKGRAAPLFVVHSYLLYSALPEALEEDRPIYGIRELDNNIHVDTLEERAMLYAREINAVYPVGPLCLAGWCAAGSLTVEVARILNEQGRGVAVVALFDAERPGYKPTLTTGKSFWLAKTISSVQFHWGRMRGLTLIQKLRYFGDELGQRWVERVEVFSTSHRIAFRWLQRNMPFLLPERLHDYAAGLGAESLLPREQQVYPGKIVLVRAADVVQVAGSEPSLGWNVVAQGGVEVEYAPGDHESMFRQPQLRQFGEILHRVLMNGESAAH